MTLEFFPGICSESYIGFLEAGSWNRESIFRRFVFPFLPSSFLEQVDEMTSEWSSSCLTVKQRALENTSMGQMKAMKIPARDTSNSF